MTDESLERRVEALFFAARRLEPAERAELLAARAADDPEAAAEVRAMLDVSEDELGRVFAEPAFDAAPLERAGDQVGPYKLLEELGEGGFGTVWRAEQLRPVRRTVALKVLKAGMDTKQVLARFEVERNALSLMNHPSIARVFDAGATRSGRPYFAMELVEGIPITAFCDQEELTIARRLELFVDACAAVQHAHQKGVIHRDLKPANILVTMQDGRPLPKVIDFGIAKATGASLSEATLFTQRGQLMGTLEYMSPEQAEMSGIGVDSTTDIYALGVVLYELLTGALPFDAETLLRHGLAGMHRFLREEEPPKPSTRVSTAGADSVAVGRRRRIDPRKLRSELSGDLDWICLRAMEKQRTRRYPSASELAADVRRHLAHQPVLAGPPSAGYLLRKFVRRHRIGVSFAATVALLLAGGIFATTRQMLIAGRERDAAEEAREDAVEAQRAAEVARADAEAQEAEAVRQRERAEESLRLATAENEKATAVTGFLVETLGLANPDETLRPDLRMVEALELASERVGERFADFPESELEVRIVIGKAYDALGRPDLAFEHLRRALHLTRRVLGSDRAEQLRVLPSLVSVSERLENPAWVAWAHESYHLGLEQIATLAPDLAGRLGALILAANEPAVPADLVRGQWDELRRELAERLPAEPPWDMVRARALHGIAYQIGWRAFSGHAPEMLGLVAQDLGKGAEHRVARWLDAQSLKFLVYANDLEGAEALARSRLEELAAILGEDHVYLEDYRCALAVCLGARGQYAEARAMLEQSLRALRSSECPDESAISTAEVFLARLHEAAGRTDLAAPLWERSLEWLLLWNGPIQWTMVELGLPPRYGEVIAACRAFQEVFVECTVEGTVPSTRAGDLRARAEELLELRRRDCPDTDRAALLFAEQYEMTYELLEEPELWDLAEAFGLDAAGVFRQQPEWKPMVRVVNAMQLCALFRAQGRLEEVDRLQREVDEVVARWFSQPGPYRDDSFFGCFLIASVARLPGAAPSTYDAMADWAEAALPWVPTRATHLGVYGRALYRANRLEQALEVLTRADRVSRMLAGDPAFPGVPSDLAGLAMTRHRLGHPDEAAAALERLRAAMGLERFAGDLESQLFAAEAEALLAR